MSSTQRQKDTDIAIIEKEEFKEPFKYHVLVHNNDYTSYDEVIIILTQSFEMSHNEALKVANKVDTEGKGSCGLYSKEVADMKLLLVNSIKESLAQITPDRAREIKMLQFTVEKE
jgi:ATP-dependent Clp protease adaptor protein ClpS